MAPAEPHMQKQLTFIPWLLNEINTGHHKGLEWVDESKQIACIPWPRATSNLPMEDLGVIYCWHKYRSRNNCNQNRSPSTIHGTFRAIINSKVSKNEITKLRNEEHMMFIKINYSGTPVTSPVRSPVTSPVRSPVTSPVTSCYSPSSSNPFDVMTSPNWAQEILRQEQNLTDSSCKVFISVWSRGRLLCDKQTDLQNGLLIYSDVSEVNFKTLTEEKCNGTFGRGSKHADKLFISQINTSMDGELCKALRNFSKGILLSSDPFYNIMVERLCAVRPYFGHSNHGGARQMPRPKDQSHVLNPVFSYIQFLEMAGYLMNMKRLGHPTNESDKPTSITYIAVGQEWTPSKPIQQLPLFIEINHDRANNFQQANLNFNHQGTSNDTSGIVVSITNSLDTRQTAAVNFDDEMLSNIMSEMPPMDLEFEEDAELSGIVQHLGLDGDDLQCL